MVPAVAAAASVARCRTLIHPAAEHNLSSPCLIAHHPAATFFRYAQKKVNDQINTIVDSCLKELQSLNRPFKYIVTCVIMQKNGAGMSTAASMFWDSSKVRAWRGEGEGEGEGEGQTTVSQPALPPKLVPPCPSILIEPIFLFAPPIGWTVCGAVVK